MEENQQDDVSMSIDEEREDVDFIFGKRLLLLGEIREQYDMLRDRIQEQQCPKTFLDHLRVRELTDYIWDSHRYKRFCDRMYLLHRIPALELLFVAAGVPHYAAAVEAKRYFEVFDPGDGGVARSASEQEKKDAADALVMKARTLASQCKITLDAINARAIMLSDFRYFDRLAIQRAALVSSSLKEEKRRRKKIAKREERETLPMEAQDCRQQKTAPTRPQQAQQ